MARPLTFTDALRILGKHDSATLDFVEKLTAGGLEALGVASLGGLRELVLTQGRKQLTAIHEKITGISRHDRTQRIAAAHRIIVTTALFEALDEVLTAPDIPLAAADLELSSQEQAHILTAMLGSGEDLPPWPLGGVRDMAQQLWGTGTRIEPLRRFIRGLAAHEQLDQTQRARLWHRLDRLPEHAERRYLEAFHRLATEVPEFGLWAQHAEHHATHDRLGQVHGALSDVERRLGELSPGGRAGRYASELAALYRRGLERPVLSSTHTPTGFTMPSLATAYLTPRARFAWVTTDSPQPHLDHWWQDQPEEVDLQRQLTHWLTHPLATERPLVILGHPGSGKSKLTEVLAARLPATDYLPIRVQLRSVPAEAPLRRQVEHALSETLHTDVSLRDLLDGSGTALPVVLLDGLDELLQATGVKRSDYLEQVQAFQEDQEAFGQPVAVLVTTRTVVADRLRFPERTVLARLEPFDTPRISRLRELWTEANTRVLAERDLHALPLDTLLEYRELAEQPLLLLMLLLYDADDNALQRPGSALSRAQLYERLLASFARREVNKHDPGMSDADLDEATESEMRRLEVTALAMFARRRQSVTAEELGTDLAVLAPLATAGTSDTGMRQQLSAAERMLGRFFFVHESRARQDTDRQVFEFLHATFGEYLVARLVVAELEELLHEHTHARRRRHARPLDDGRFYAVTSFAVTAGRGELLEFLTELLRQRITEEPELAREYRELLIELFRDAPYPRPNRSHTGYEPRRVPVVARQAVHTANLVVLLTLVTEEATGIDPDAATPHTDITELMPDDASPLEAWTSEANLWRGCLADEEWYGLMTVVRVRHLGYGHGTNTPRTLLERERGQQVNVGECVGFDLLAGPDIDSRAVCDPYRLWLPAEQVTARLLRSIALRGNGTAARLTLALLPYLEHVDSDPLRWIEDPTGTAPTMRPETPDSTSVAPPRPTELAAQRVLDLRLAPITADPRHSVDHVRALLAASTLLGRRELLALRQAVEGLRLWFTETSNPDVPRGGDIHDHLLNVLNGVSTKPSLRGLATEVPQREVDALCAQLPSAAGIKELHALLIRLTTEHEDTRTGPDHRLDTDPEPLPEAAWGSAPPPRRPLPSTWPQADERQSGF
ncbi:hypothetical protein RIF23_01060 [Lipingzhangella sp. LS1_29]|uniref:NACHT N-terminal Helical domain-containing protein n=1 Tax=Lipingzhangella rawalii TaxID=2055835 RepID=A0ABU2H1K6_9ACTN|nr:hypothetical protein [Lipingzhangella rawalii]MDS1268877.1 hypothetical protein [Lipingzhangella rawalii]